MLFKTIRVAKPTEVFPIELVYFFPAFGHLNAMKERQCVHRQKVESVAAITVDEIFTVVGNAPAFTGDAKPFVALHVFLVVNKSYPASPCELVDFVIK